ncbi:hypothetical protein [uncultured Arcobacter sp.]|uniref:hypothetical protein n=1 Tax=uncultured Arcobacter sp. TaxID=165434 RepID=UPI002635A29B|nr:hypothetical protein [uncultured Arcobacter sp.]
MKTIKEVYDLEEKIKEAIDYKLGYVKRAYEVRRFNIMYDKKHKKPEYEAVLGVDRITNDAILLKYEANRVYTMGRYFGRYHNINKVKEMPLK